MCLKNPEMALKETFECIAIFVILNYKIKLKETSIQIFLPYYLLCYYMLKNLNDIAC